MPLSLAEEADRTHVLQRLQVLLDPLVRDLRDFCLIARRQHVQAQNQLRVRVDLLNDERLGLDGKLTDDGRELVADVLRGRFDLAFERERDRDVGESLAGGGA